VIALELKRSETISTQYQIHEALERAYTTYDEVTCQGNRKPYGAVILKKCRNNKFMAVGALTFTDDKCRNITSAFFPLHLVKHKYERQLCQNCCKTTAVNMNWNLEWQIARMVEIIYGFSYWWCVLSLLVTFVYFQLGKVCFFICVALLINNYFGYHKNQIS